MRIKKEFKNPAQEQNIWVEAGEIFFYSVELKCHWIVDR